jgi:hypothetical protein
VWRDSARPAACVVARRWRRQFDRIHQTHLIVDVDTRAKLRQSWDWPVSITPKLPHVLPIDQFIVDGPARDLGTQPENVSMREPAAIADPVVSFVWITSPDAPVDGHSEFSV